DRPQMDDALPVYRGVERCHHELARELAGDVRREQVDFSVVPEFNQRQRRAVIGIGVYADEVLGIRPAYWNGRQQLLNPSRLHETLVEAESVQIERVGRRRVGGRPRGAGLRLKSEGRHNRIPSVGLSRAASSERELVWF